MITFKKLEWDNWFSYGEHNNIDFTKDPLTQLMGKNGAGKTSIPIILQEVLYGKNSKKIVKSKLLNRNMPGKTVSATLYFTDSHNEYKVIVSRKGAKLTIELYKDGENISSHTAPATLKTIENIIAVDFDTFAQLVYQSSTSSLQFLTATDTQRKKFLITLFNLEKYSDIHQTFKTKLSSIKNKAIRLDEKYNTHKNWLADLKKKENQLLKLELENIPPHLEDEVDKVSVLNSDLKNIDRINKDINRNNTYKKQLDSIDKELLNKQVNKPSDIDEQRKQKILLTSSISQKQKLLNELESLKPICPSCKQPIDISESIKLADKTRSEIEKFSENLSDISIRLKKSIEMLQSWEKINTAITEFENITNLIDLEIPTDIINSDDIKTEIKELTSLIRERELEIVRITEANKKINGHNSKAEVLIEQRDEYENLIIGILDELEEVNEEIIDLDIIVRAFSTNGLVSYKLEYLTKDLENVINEYLENLSQGRFNINFILKEDKLNIEVCDDGNIITINELSEGELSKVNVSTLLATRKLMQDLSNTKLNILFLDEIMGKLDGESRDELVNILLKEQTLNTFLVTHEYSHPLIPIIYVNRDENNISRLE